MFQFNKYVTCFLYKEYAIISTAINAHLDLRFVVLLVRVDAAEDPRRQFSGAPPNVDLVKQPLVPVRPGASTNGRFPSRQKKRMHFFKHVPASSTTYGSMLHIQLLWRTGYVDTVNLRSQTLYR